MGGRLASFLPRWRLVTTDQVILEAVSGYKLPFRAHPAVQLSEPVVHLSDSEQIICALEIDRLRDLGAIELVSDCEGQFISPFFILRKSSGGWRFILNLKELNNYIIVPHFKLEDWKTAMRLLSPGDYLASIDLKDAYLTILIHEAYRKYLRFRFQGHLYQFRALPFGLASAPYLFSRILKPVLYSLRKEGLFSVAYLDDFLLIAPDFDRCSVNVSTTLNLLSDLGFLVNREKSVLIPSTSCRFLGFLFDTRSFSIAIPPDRRTHLLKLTSAFLSKKSCKIREFASFIGSLVSVCPAVLYGILHTKLLERVKFRALLDADDNFNAQMTLPVSIREDLIWWKDNFEDNSQINKIRPGNFDLTIFSDASTSGWGAVCADSRTHGFWSSGEKQFHINYLELLAVYHGLRCFASHLCHVNILLRIDNATAIAYINRMGSVKFPHLSDLSRKIWLWCADRDIFLFASYIPSSLNVEADAESRGVSPSLEKDFPGGSEIIRKAFRLRGTPSVAIETTLGSITPSTIAQYTKPLRLWWNFCLEKQVDCFSPPVSAFLEFLSDRLLEVSSYSTLNSYRSAISLISNNDIGSNPLVRRFFRGVASLKPQRPRYDFIWNPSPVIEHLATIYPYEDVPLEIISRKLITLLALTTAQRMQTLAAIRISNIRFSDRLTIKIPDKLKTSGVGRSQPFLSFKPFKERPELCVFSLTRHYIELSREVREIGCDPLFISCRRPYKPVSSQTLGHWVKSELGAAGVDVSIFSAHSTRHAATSLAASKGINLEEIRRTAGWTKSSDVFARLYKRPILKENFQSAILSINE
ncbi:uncharacterized protein [Cardiocondyla obscurior]|uniref:uncharacterized protein n=1 Tax=Cardiocondyla obscurior TaxID=286306 RepID=UPI0039657C79